MMMSLNLLAERLNLKPDTYHLSSGGAKRYDRVLIAQPQSALPQDHALYLCRFIPDSRYYKNRTVGFIFLDVDEQALSAITCDYLYICGDHDFITAFNRISSTMSSIFAQIGNLKEAALAHADLQSLIEQLYDLFGNPAYLVDSSFKCLAIESRFHTRDLSATWRRLEDYGYLPLELISNLIHSRELGVLESETEASLIHSNYFYTPFINYNLRDRGILQGHLFIVEIFKRITPGDIELADAVGAIILQSMLGNISFQHRRGYIYEHFMRSLFRGEIRDPSYVKQQSVYLNLKPGLRLVGKFIPHQMDELLLERLSRQLEINTDVRLARDDTGLTGLFTVKNPDAADTLFANLNRLGTSFDFRCGVSDCFEDIYHTSIYAAQAEKAAARGQREELTLSRYHDCAVKDFIDRDEKELSIFTPPVIEQMRHYDRLHDTQYIPTLLTYLLNERSAQATAQALNIHRNTLSYRIERMEELFKLDLDDPQLRLRCLISLL